jgi:predicted O-linked N-acetylglucosamine transferase (SPINDLY family)
MDIYQYAQDNIEPNERDNFIKQRYELCMKNLKKYVVCNELNIINNSITYVFEHIKDALIGIVATFVHPNKRDRLLSKQWDTIEYRKFLLDILVDLEYRSIILWFFLYTNYFNHDDLDNQRKRLLENIELLSEFYPRKMYFESVDDLFWACPITNLLYSISYQNRNNKVILQNYCALMRKICPSLNYDIVTGKPRSKNPKIRVLFLSEFLTMDSSVLRDRMGVMVKLPRTKFDVFYAAFDDVDKIYGNVSKHLYQIIGNNYIQLGNEIIENRNKIARHNFDIIVYCELGMRMRPYWLSYSRLAPVQVVTWGHSETSGVDTIDYFISSKYFEHEKAQNHYSEQLVQMDSLSTYYFPPSQIFINNYKYQTRKDLKLDDNINLYGCIQSSFKISKQFEMILYHILDKDKNGYILMSYYKPFCKSQMERIYQTFGEEKFRRLLFYPELDMNNYLNLVKLMDVMLDPYPFGGCNTTYEAFDYDIPVVTLPTRFLNGRFTFGLYKKMGFIDMIATTADNYVKLAVKCGTDKQFRQSIVNKIKENKYSIFMEEESIKEWSNFLEEKGICN